MAAVSTPTFVDAQKVLATRAASGGPTDDEKIKFADGALALLADDDQAAKFADNVKQVGTWGNQIDASFDRVARGLDDMVAKYGKDLPGFANYSAEWKGYNARWVTVLALSQDVASKQIRILRRFDQLVLDMVESIVTDQDRKDAIIELQQFIDEKPDDFAGMSQSFLMLKRDIQEFVVRLDLFIVDEGVELKILTKQLEFPISELRSEIEVLDEKINHATIAPTATGAFLHGSYPKIVGVMGASSVLAASQSELDGKAEDLLEKEKESANVNRKQEALAQLKSDFDDLKPGIALICEKLVLFADIWNSAQIQQVQFQEYLKEAMDETAIDKFKKEVCLARDMCKPLRAGLETYITELENRN